MNELALRVLTVVGLGSFLGAPVAAWVATALRPVAPVIAAGRLGRVVQVGVAALAAGALASSELAPRRRAAPALLVLLAGLVLRRFVKTAAARFGAEALPGATALAVLGGFGVAWSARLTGCSWRAGLVQALALALGTGGGLALSALLARALLRPTGWLHVMARSPWTWTAATAALLGSSLVLGRPVQLRDGTGEAIRGVSLLGLVSLQPAGIAFAVGAPIALALGLQHFAPVLQRGVVAVGGRLLPDPVVPLASATLFALMFAMPLRLAGEHGILVLGAALLLAALLVISRRPAVVAVGAAAGVVGAVALALSSARVADRLSAWIDRAGGGEPGYQVKQALFAVASSRLVGTGVGLGRPRDIPVASQDFAPAAAIEELGLAGLGIFLAAVAVILSIALRRLQGAQQGPPGAAHAAAVAAVLAAAVLIEVAFGICMSIGLAPVTGVPVPFLSASGTATLGAVLAATTALGLCWRTR